MLCWNTHALNNCCYDFVMLFRFQYSFSHLLLSPWCHTSCLCTMWFSAFKLPAIWQGGMYVGLSMFWDRHRLRLRAQRMWIHMHCDNNHAGQLQAMIKVARENLGAEKHVMTSKPDKEFLSRGQVVCCTCICKDYNFRNQLTLVIITCNYYKVEWLLQFPPLIFRTPLSYWLHGL